MWLVGNVNEQLPEMLVGADRLRAFSALTESWDTAMEDGAFGVVVVRGPSGAGRTAMLQWLYRHCAMWDQRPRYWPADLVDRRAGFSEAAAGGVSMEGELLYPRLMVPDEGSRLGMFWWGLRGEREVFAALKGEPQIEMHIEGLADAVARVDKLTRERLLVALDAVCLLGSLLPVAGAPMAEAAKAGLEWVAAGKDSPRLIKRFRDVRPSRSTLIDKARRSNAGRVLSVGERGAAEERAEHDARALAMVASMVPFAIVVDDAQLLDDVTVRMLKVIAGQSTARGLIVLAVNTDLDEALAADAAHGHALHAWLDELQRTGRLTSINLPRMTQPEMLEVAALALGTLPHDEPGVAALASVVASSHGSPGRLTFLLRVPSIHRAITDSEQLPADLERFNEQNEAEEAFEALPASARAGLATAALQGPITYASWLTTSPPGDPDGRPAITSVELDAAVATRWIHVSVDGIARFSSDVLFRVARDRAATEVSQRIERAWQSLAAWVTWVQQSEEWVLVPAFLAESVLTTLVLQPPAGVRSEPAWNAELMRVRRVTGRQTADEATLSALEQRLRTGSHSAVLIVATAEALFDAGHTQRALDVLQAELDRLTGRHGHGSPATFPALQNLAIAYAAIAHHRSGHPDAVEVSEHAISLYRQLLTGREHYCKSGDRRIPDTRWAIAQLLSEIYRYSDAIKVGQQSVEEMRHCADYGPDPDTRGARTAVALWTGQSGDAVGARNLLVALLRDEMRVLGPDHIYTLETRSEVAAWTGYAGNAAGARELFAVLLPDQMRVLGADNPTTLTMRNNLAHWTGEAGDAAGARDLFAALLPDQVGVMGPDHPNTLGTRNNVAGWTGNAGDAVGARDFFVTLLSDRVRVQGPDDVRTLGTRNNLAGWTGYAGDAAGARDLYAALLSDMVRVLGPDHPHTLTARDNLALWTQRAKGVRRRTVPDSR